MQNSNTNATHAPRMVRSLAFVVVAFTTLIALASTALGAGPVVDSKIEDVIQISTATDSLGTDSYEFSGATWNADLNRLLVVDNGRSAAYEFELDGSKAIDYSAPARKLDLQIGSDLDIEGVAWISGDTYAFVDERGGEIIVAEVSQSSTIVNKVTDRISVVGNNYVYQNKGPEGLAWDGKYWYVPTEKYPPRISRFTADGTPAGEINLNFDMTDVSGVGIDTNGDLLALGDEDAEVRHLRVNDWDTGAYEDIGTLGIYSFAQAEGIAVIDNNDLHVFGERKSQSQATYAHFSGEITTEWIKGDVDCNGTLSITDAHLVALSVLGGPVNKAKCWDGDANGDGIVNIADSGLIARCFLGDVSACPDYGTPAIAAPISGLPQ